MDLVVLGIPVGIVLLYFGSDWLVKGAKDLALKLGISPFVVGLTIIAFGSSAPEIITAVVSSGTPDLVLGNSIGSNIVNIGIAIGLAALICPMAADFKSMRVEIGTMVLMAAVMFLLALTGTVGFAFGVLLVAILILFLCVVYRMKKGNPSAGTYTSEVGTGMPSRGYPVLILLIAAGLVLLYFGANWFVDGATELAYEIGISELLVGLVVVAIGTSLPEICICLIAAKRGENELAVSNIVGSNIFNATAVLGAGALLADIRVSGQVLYFHIPAMFLLSVLMYGMVRYRGGISRASAAVLLAVYVAYTAIMIAVPSLTA